ncbi:MAG: nucleotidyltransferase family protein [Clostridiales Family XIII bacterium]|jgi:predicted nucleotidyltransferase|nr:nucleotidyltransferase family protein [Clostridiales Family XIII bacterium]
MPKTLGIIAEYDPFHKGHAYCLEEAKRQSGADRSVCIMSGPFVQRGEPSLFNKYLRAEAAVRNGIDLVLELPFVYAATGAENFARGGVRALAGIGICDAIAFGSERAVESPGTVISDLKEIAQLFAFETKEFSEKTQLFMKQGLSYPAARQEALRGVLGEERAALVQHPNDILDIEYLRQIVLLEAERSSKAMMCFRPAYMAAGGGRSPEDIELYAIPRIGSGPDTVNEKGGFAGASAIRSLLRVGRIGRGFAFTTDRSADVFKNGIIEEIPTVSAWECKSNPLYEYNLAATPQRGHIMVFPDDLYDALCYSLIAMHVGEPEEIYSASEGLENRLLTAAGRAENFRDLVQAVKSKRYTETRIRRFFLHTALRLSKAEMEEALSERICVRVLAFNAQGAEMLREIHGIGPEVYVYQNLRQEQDELDRSRMMISLGIRADKLYHMLGFRTLTGFRYSPEPVRV